MTSGGNPFANRPDPFTKARRRFQRPEPEQIGDDDDLDVVERAERIVATALARVLDRLAEEDAL